MLVSPTPVLTHEPHRVRIVDHHQGLILVGQITDRGQVRKKPIHQNIPSVAIIPKLAGRSRLKFPRGRPYRRRVSKSLGLTQTNAIDDACMINFIRDDRVILTQDGLEQTPFGIGTESDRIVSSVPERLT